MREQSDTDRTGRVMQNTPSNKDGKSWKMQEELHNIPVTTTTRVEAGAYGMATCTGRRRVNKGGTIKVNTAISGTGRTHVNRKNNGKKASGTSDSEVGPQHSGPEDNSRTVEDTPDNGKEQATMDWVKLSRAEGAQHKEPEDTSWTTENASCNQEEQLVMKKVTLSKKAEDGIHVGWRIISKETAALTILKALRRSRDMEVTMNTTGNVERCS